MSVESVPQANSRNTACAGGFDGQSRDYQIKSFLVQILPYMVQKGFIVDRSIEFRTGLPSRDQIPCSRAHHHVTRPYRHVTTLPFFGLRHVIRSLFLGTRSYDRKPSDPLENRSGSKRFGAKIEQPEFICTNICVYARLLFLRYLCACTYNGICACVRVHYHQLLFLCIQ